MSGSRELGDCIRDRYGRGYHFPRQNSEKIVDKNEDELVIFMRSVFEIKTHN